MNELELFADAITNWLKAMLPWLFGASVVVEFVPIKINPWSTLLKWIGKATLGDRLDKLEKDLNDTKASIERKEAKDARTAILHFSDDLVFYPERRYSKDRFDEVIHCITEYDKYCKDHPDFPNHITQSSSTLILDEYHRRMVNHDFL